MTEGPKWTDIAIVILTVGIVFFALMQWLEMRGAGHQTDQLVSYAKAQADAASNQADAAQQFSDTAEDINDEMSGAVDQLQAAAGNTKRGIRAAQDALRLDQRAWVGVTQTEVPAEIREGAGIAFKVWIVNSGKTPAKKFATRGAYRLLYNDEQPDPGKILANLPLLGNDVLQAGGRRYFPLTVKTPVTKAQLDALNSNAAVFYIFGEITYEDVFKKPHFTKWCLRLTTEPADPLGFTQCDEYNDAN